MDSALGIQYKDGVVLATDGAVSYSIFKLKVIIYTAYIIILLKTIFIIVSRR